MNTSQPSPASQLSPADKLCNIIKPIMEESARATQQMMSMLIVKMDNNNAEQIIRTSVLEKKFDELGKRFDDLNKRLDEMAQKSDEMIKRSDELNKRLDEAVRAIQNQQSGARAPIHEKITFITGATGNEDSDGLDDLSWL